MDLRQLKGLEIAARHNISFAQGAWLVPSQSSPGTRYRVTLGDRLCCECDDFQLRREACKHVIAAQIVCARDHGGKAPQISGAAAPLRPTYKQNWPLYNEAQQTEKHRFRVLLFELCRGLSDPPQPGPGRRRTRMADMVFACVLKVFTTLSSRRFACDLQDAQQGGHLSHLMNSVSVCSYLESDLLTAVLQKLIVQSSLPLRSVERSFAPDSTGLSTSRFIRWFDEKYGGERCGRLWVKTHAMCGVKTNIVTAVEIHGPYAADCPQFAALVAKTAENFTIEEVPADKAYLSVENLEQVDRLGGTAFIPFKANSVAGEAGSLWEKMFHYYHFRRDEFLKHYHQRSNAESTFSMIKAKFGDAVRSRDDTAMKNEALCKLICHNICVVHQSHIELGIVPVFWSAQPHPATRSGPALPSLPLPSATN